MAETTSQSAATRHENHRQSNPSLIKPSPLYRRFGYLVGIGQFLAGPDPLAGLGTW